MLTLPQRTSNILKAIPDAKPAIVAIALGISRDKAANLLRLGRIALGAEIMHHPGKAAQIHRILKGRKNLDIYESNGELGTSGQPGHCSLAYAKYGDVTSMWTKDGDIMETTYKALLSKKLYDVLDLDPYQDAVEPLGAGVLNVLKPRGVLFLTWGPESQLRRWVQARARALCYAGVERLEGAVRNVVVQREALRSGRKVRFIEEVRFDDTTRQVWEVTAITESTPRTRLELEAIRKVVTDAGVWAPMNLVDSMKKAVHEA